MTLSKYKKLPRYLLAVLCIIFLIYLFCPKPELKFFTTYSSALFDANDKLLRVSLSHDQKYRIYESIDNIASVFLKTTVLYEDKNFYKNSGVDFLALSRAFWSTYILQERRIGASTITMQVARLRWNITSSTISGKILQIFRAIQLSRHYSKKEILESYINLAPYGRNIEGIAAASLIYFNKKPSELSFVEAITLAVVPQNPNKRNPTTQNGYQNLLSARTDLYERWLRIYPGDYQFKRYLTMPLNIRSPEGLPFDAPHFVNYVLGLRSKWDHGVVDTTLDMLLQKKVQSIVSDYVNSRTNEGVKNASALLIDHRTMEIKAMVGSANFFDDQIQGQVNGTSSKRSPGSTLKPFVYALAIDEGIIHPATLMKDSPSRFGGFTPENYDKQFLGPILARDALIQSRNVPAVNLQSQLKQRSFHDFLIDAGITGLKNKEFYGLALALGGGEVTMLELVKLYGILVNKGVLREISAVKSNKMDQIDGKIMLSPESSYLVLDILKNNPAPNDLNLDLRYLKKNEIAWKTGTSWAFRDAWSIGVSGNYILAVWLGNFNGKGSDVFVGRSTAGPLLFSILEAVNQSNGWKISDLVTQNSLNLKQVKVCSKTGDLQTKNCPSSINTWFIPGISPIKVSNIYRAIPIDTITGLRACSHKPGKTNLRVYAFWPSDFLHIFHQAGISLETPPRYKDICSLDQKSSVGQSPVIKSPQSNIKYIIKSDAIDSSQIPFMATVDSDVNEIFWFINGKYEGRSKRGQAYVWKAVSGSYEVRAVDDSGRGASKRFKVLQH